MEVILTNHMIEIRRYRAKVTELGFLTPDTTPDSKRYGTYKYIVIRDVDDDRDVSLQTVVVGVRCASLFKEGAELTILYGHSQDGESVNCLLAVVADGQVENDFAFLRSQIDLALNSLRALKTKYTFQAIVLFGMTLPLLLWIVPGFLTLGLGIYMWSQKVKVRKAIESIQKAIPTQAGFERMLNAL